MAGRRPCPFLVTLAFGVVFSLDDLAVEALQLGDGVITYRYVNTAVPADNSCVPSIVDVASEEDALDMEAEAAQSRQRADALRSMRLLKRMLEPAERPAHRQRHGRRQRTHGKKFRLRDEKGEALDLKPAEDR